MSRSYRQFCGLARALDVIGDRWTLLIVRELLIAPARFKDLEAGLPGVATNLLTGRLKELIDQGVIQRLEVDGRPVYSLTEFGRGLREPIAALVRWSTPLMVIGPQGDHEDARWLAVALPALLANAASTELEEVTLVADGVPMRVTADDSRVSVTLGEATPNGPDVSLGEVLLAAVMSRTFEDFASAVKS